MLGLGMKSLRQSIALQNSHSWCYDFYKILREMIFTKMFDQSEYYENNKEFSKKKLTNCQTFRTFFIFTSRSFFFFLTSRCLAWLDDSNYNLPPGYLTDPSHVALASFSICFYRSIREKLNDDNPISWQASMRFLPSARGPWHISRILLYNP